MKILVCSNCGEIIEFCHCKDEYYKYTVEEEEYGKKTESMKQADELAKKLKLKPVKLKRVDDWHGHEVYEVI